MTEASPEHTRIWHAAYARLWQDVRVTDEHHYPDGSYDVDWATPPTDDEPYKGWHIATWDGDKKTTCTCVLTHDHPIEQTTIAFTPPADNEREALARIVDPPAWREPIFPETYRELARSESLAIADKILERFRRQGPITDAARDAARKAAYLAWIATDVSPDGPNLHTIVDAALEAARDAS